MTCGSEFNSLISQLSSEQKEGYHSQQKKQKKPGRGENNHQYLNSGSLSIFDLVLKNF